MLKKELVWLGEHMCKHGHSYLEHYSCYLKDAPNIDAPFIERVGFFDIEATNLSADFGYVFSYCIKELDGDIVGRVLKPDEILSYTFDKKLMKELVDDLKEFDRIVVHYGTDRKFDLPFCRSRCLKWGIKFPRHLEIYAQDTFTMAKAKLRLSRNRLENICAFFDIPAKGHKLNPSVWQKALAGDKTSLSYIYKHNEEDVISLEAVWKKLSDYYRKSKTSI
jgi:uncharacterized protein YprB with RNaseH-like and TPR domain